MVQVTSAAQLLNSYAQGTTNFEQSTLDNANLYGVQLQNVDLSGSSLVNTNFNNATLTGVNFNNANLKGANLNGSNLLGATFTGASLTGTQLYGADLNADTLNNVDFNGAILAAANLNGSNLLGATFVGTNLNNTQLYGANLTGDDLTGDNLNGALLAVSTLNNTILHNAQLYNANLNSASAIGVDLSNANLATAQLYGANLTNANLFGANLSYAQFQSANFTNANLTGGVFYGTNLNNVILNNANLQGDNLTGVNFYYSNLTGAQLSGANLTGAQLSGANLTGAQLYKANLSGALLQNTIFNGTQGLTYQVVEGAGSTLQASNNPSILISQGDQTLIGGSASDIFYGGAGDSLYGESLENSDTFVATQALNIVGNNNVLGMPLNNTLIANYSYSDYGTGIILNPSSINVVLPGSSPNGISLISNFQGIENLNITGTKYDDVFNDTHLNVNITAGSGNDTFYGELGTFTGGTGKNTLIADYSKGLYMGNVDNITTGIEFIANATGGGEVLETDNYNKVLTFSNVNSVQIKGTASQTNYLNDSNSHNNDTLIAGNAGDYITGGSGNDTLIGGAGNDVIKGGSGNDLIYATSDINGSTKNLWGGSGSNTFIIDVQGSVTQQLNFNVQQLGDFINAITLPSNTGPDFTRLGIDAGFGLVGTALGLVPDVGPALSFLTSIAQTGVDTYLAQNALEQQINEQLTATANAVAQFGSNTWGSLVASGTRDTVIINDFKIGRDTILLPKLPTDNTYHYEFHSQSDGTNNGVAVFIVKPNNGDETSEEVAYITNNYFNVGVSNDDFATELQNLLTGPVIGTFNQNPFTQVDIANNLGDGATIAQSFANNTIDYTKSLIGHTIVAGYGDDVILGSNGGDTIYAGDDNFFNNFYGSNLTFSQNNHTPGPNIESVYGYNNGGNISPGGYGGNDIVKGGNGNNHIYGGSGNDYLAAGTGKDVIVGGSGNDIIKSGGGGDTLTGGTGTNKFDYQTLANSTLATHDIITNFDASSGKNFFVTTTARSVFSNLGAISSLDAATIGANLDATHFTANSAVSFTVGSDTYVALNAGVAGFHANSDALIELQGTGFQGTLSLANFITAPFPAATTTPTV